MTLVKSKNQLKVGMMIALTEDIGEGGWEKWRAEVVSVSPTVRFRILALTDFQRKNGTRIGKTFDATPFIPDGSYRILNSVEHMSEVEPSNLKPIYGYAEEMGL